jgi:hypothetical protein
MPIKIVIDEPKAWVHCHGNCSEEELIAASNRMLDLSDAGYYFPQNPFLLPGKERFRRDRRRDCVRECARLEELGLESLGDIPRKVRMPDGRLAVWRADWEYLNSRHYIFALHRVDGVVMYLPLRANGELLLKLNYNHLRCLTGDSQSFLEKHGQEFPGAPTDARRYGKRFFVETIKYFTHFNDPAYPVMRLHRDPFNPFSDVSSPAVRMMP